MSSYTIAYIEWDGCQEQLAEVLDYEEDDCEGLELMTFNIYKYHHSECDVHELRKRFNLVINHELCTGVYTDFVHVPILGE